MNDLAKKEKKLNKMATQIGYLSYKLMLLSQKDMCKVTGNGLVIEIRKWKDVVNERKYVEDKQKNKHRVIEDSKKDETLEKQDRDKRQIKQTEGGEKGKEKTFEK